MRPIPAVGLALWVVVMPAFGQTPVVPFEVPETVERIPDLTYATYGDLTLELDLYVPRADPARSAGERAARAAVIVIRGGGFRLGDKEGFGPLAAALAERGFIAASIEQRTSDQAVFPGAIEDAKAAVRWMRANADQYGIDPDRIGGVGASTGGYLVLMLATTGGDPRFEGSGGHQEVSSRIQAAVALAPLTNLFEVPGENVVGFMGGPPGRNALRWEIASPIAHVGEGDAPVLLVHGSEDVEVPPVQSEQFRDGYLRRGLRAELLLIPGATHALLREEPVADRILDAAVAFLREILE